MLRSSEIKPLFNRFVIRDKSFSFFASLLCGVLFGERKETRRGDRLPPLKHLLSRVFCGALFVRTLKVQTKVTPTDSTSKFRQRRILWSSFRHHFFRLSFSRISYIRFCGDLFVRTLKSDSFLKTLCAISKCLKFKIFYSYLIF